MRFSMQRFFQHFTPLPVFAILAATGCGGSDDGELTGAGSGGGGQDAVYVVFGCPDSTCVPSPEACDG